jgi:hypothetical protein
MLGLVDMQLSVFNQIKEKNFFQHLLHGCFFVKRIAYYSSSDSKNIRHAQEVHHVKI